MLQPLESPQARPHTRVGVSGRRLAVTLVPNLLGLRQVLQTCKALKAWWQGRKRHAVQVLYLSNKGEHPMSLQFFTEASSTSCPLS